MMLYSIYLSVVYAAYLSVLRWFLPSFLYDYYGKTIYYLRLPSTGHQPQRQPPFQNTHTPRLYQVGRYARLSGYVNESGWSTVEWCEIDWRLGNAPQETGTGIDPSLQSCVNAVVMGARRRRDACRSRQKGEWEVWHSRDMVKTLAKKGAVYPNLKMENQTSAKHRSSSISVHWSVHLNI